MSNGYYEPGRDRAQKVHQLFSGIASRYDLINDAQSFGLHRLWKKKLIQMAHPREGDRAVDLCCGTGDIAFGLARQGAQVNGLDFTMAMLTVAAKRPDSMNSAHPRNPKFLCGDALHIPFPDESFDIVTIGYGLRNLSEWERGLQEMHRVAKPGARILSLEFGKPDNPVWRKMYFGYLRCFVPALGKIFCGDAQAYAYILESLKNFPAQKGIAAKMTELKFANVKVVNLLGGIMSINYGEKPRG
jgi:demethylmenaquinone methyltransferase / 2-methoxy-6-polyprenyl-1,4-benzoquinol methylase